MSALAVAHPRRVHLRPVPDLPPEPPVTVTISIAGGAAPGRDRVLAALRDLVELAGTEVEVEVEGGIRLEYDLLLFLARHPRQVFSRSQLLAQVWGHTHTTNRTVDVHVSRLRTKLDDPDVVTTVYGLGYRLADEAAVTVV
jgi:hypothetical protein